MMKKSLAVIFSSLFILANAGAADSVDAKTALAAGTVVELKDGGKIAVQKDGTTLHTDASGKAVEMKDGVLMEGKDGQMYVMKNKVVRKHVTEKRGGMTPR